MALVLGNLLNQDKPSPMASCWCPMIIYSCASFGLQDLKAQAETMSWVMWQMGGLGPMQGQANHFVR